MNKNNLPKQYKRPSYEEEGKRLLKSLNEGVAERNRKHPLPETNRGK